MLLGVAKSWSHDQMIDSRRGPWSRYNLIQLDNAAVRIPISTLRRQMRPSKLAWGLGRGWALRSLNWYTKVRLILLG